MKRVFLLLLLAARVPLYAQSVSPATTPSEALGLPATAQVGIASTGPRAEVESSWAAGDKKNAMKRLDKWMEDEKLSPWPWVAAAKFQCEQKKFKKCVSLSQNALDKDPNCSEAYFWKGRGLEGQNKTLDAANEYRAALSGPNKFLDAQKDLDRLNLTLGQ
jgi:tetratricopeptide (TPR) repeat protein